MNTTDNSMRPFLVTVTEIKDGIKHELQRIVHARSSVEALLQVQDKVGHHARVSVRPAYQQGERNV